MTNSEFDKLDNPLKNAPHTYLELAANEWNHKYTREQAAFQMNIYAIINIGRQLVEWIMFTEIEI